MDGVVMTDKAGVSGRLWAALAIAVVAAVAVGFFFGKDGEQAVDAQQHYTSPSSPIKVRLIGEDGKLAAIPVSIPPIALSDEEWTERLTKEQFYILRKKGTERRGSGSLLKNKDEGMYVCAGCSLPLFASETKFESGTGWPSFYQAVAKENVLDVDDRSLGMMRTESVCARCGGHLGHVFPDGPKPTGLRYCMNSESLAFVATENLASLAEKPTSPSSAANKKPKVGGHIPLPEKDIALAAKSGTAEAIFAGGCFWCTEAVFEGLDGVKQVISGYIGGDSRRTDYRSVTTGTTGHAEAIRIIYDPSKMTYGQLLHLFFATHDPTTLNRQGPDRGTQYRSAIFTKDDEYKAVAQAYIDQLNEVKAFKRSIVTALEPMAPFYQAESYHQDFVKMNPNHGYVRQWALPKIEKRDKLLKDIEKP
jgi:peptide methionine sulfoxide reductase msrA/msrB